MTEKFMTAGQFDAVNKAIIETHEQLAEELGGELDPMVNDKVCEALLRFVKPGPENFGDTPLVDVLRGMAKDNVTIETVMHDLGASTTKELLETIADVIETQYDERQDDDVRRCDVCGEPLCQGYTDELFYVCEKHFESYMTEKYEHWKQNDHEDEPSWCGGYYDAYDAREDVWYDTEFYWTEWDD